MKEYQSVTGKVKRIFRVHETHIEGDVYYLVADVWEQQFRTMRYTPELVNMWGFKTLSEFMAWKINRHHLKEVSI